MHKNKEKIIIIYKVILFVEKLYPALSWKDVINTKKALHHKNNDEEHW